MPCIAFWVYGVFRSTVRLKLKLSGKADIVASDISLGSALAKHLGKIGVKVTNRPFAKDLGLAFPAGRLVPRTKDVASSRMTNSTSRAIKVNKIAKINKMTKITKMT